MIPADAATMDVQTQADYDSIVEQANRVRSVRLEHIETLPEGSRNWGRTFIEAEWQFKTMFAYDQWMVAKGRQSCIQPKD